MRWEDERVSGGGNGGCLVPLMQDSYSERRVRASREPWANSLALSLDELVEAIIRLALLAMRVDTMLDIFYGTMPPGLDSCRVFASLIVPYLGRMM
jgi:hypothetical protein